MIMQNKNRFTNQVIRWMKDDIEKDEFLALKAGLTKMKDTELEPLLQHLWDESDDKKDFDQKRRKNGWSNIQNRITIHKMKKRMRYMQLAACMIPALFILAFAYFTYSHSRTPLAYKVCTMKGEKSFVEMPDSSIIWINSESSVRYNSDYGTKNRLVEVTGTGFFDIASNNEEKMIVKAGNIHVVVKGTKFNVKNDGEIVEVALLEGKVDIMIEGGKKLTSLLPDQQIHINKQNTDDFYVESIDTGPIAAWIHNELVIANEDLYSIVSKLESWYGVNIKLYHPDSQEKFTFTMKTESLNEALRILSQLMKIEYSIKGKEVIIKKL